MATTKRKLVLARDVTRIQPRARMLNPRTESKSHRDLTTAATPEKRRRGKNDRTLKIKHVRSGIKKRNSVRNDNNGNHPRNLDARYFGRLSKLANAESLTPIDSSLSTIFVWWYGLGG
jgi:ABC-type phosphonate transport system ATPase subunit